MAKKPNQDWSKKLFYAVKGSLELLLPVTETVISQEAASDPVEKSCTAAAEIGSSRLMGKTGHRERDLGRGREGTSDGLNFVSHNI